MLARLIVGWDYEWRSSRVLFPSFHQLLSAFADQLESVPMNKRVSAIKSDGEPTRCANLLRLSHEMAQDAFLDE